MSSRTSAKVLISILVMSTTTVGTFQTVSAAQSQHSLAVQINGKGTITGPNVSCTGNSTCTQSLANASSLLLLATPDTGWRFAGWWGDSCRGTGNCPLTLSGNTTIAATFIQQQTRLQNGNTGYPLLQQALSESATDSTVMAMAGIYKEEVTLSSGRSITLTGGYDNAFNTQNGTSILDGTLTVANGLLTINGLTIATNSSSTQPTANAGTDRSSYPGWSVSLDGSASIANNSSSLSYRWELAAKPMGSTCTLANATTATPSFTPDLSGLYIARLVVNNGQFDSVADTATISVESLGNTQYSATSIFTSPEAPAVADQDSYFYTQQQQSTVLPVNINTYTTSTTKDGVTTTYTLDDVNNDTDAYDAVEPEVNAHFLSSDYPDDGVQINAALRLRGKSSRLAAQKSYRLKLAKDGTTQRYWRNETTLQLNKHPWDLSRVRNKLAFDLFRDIPHLPSLRTQFMQINVDDDKTDGSNDGNYGLFTHVEKAGAEFLTIRNRDLAGNIYKANDFAFIMVDALALGVDGKTPADKAAFELILEIENKNKDHSKLLAMINAVNDEATPINTTINTYFNRNNYITWLATNILTGNRDTVNQNFILYQPVVAENTFYFIPWDYDGSFGFENQPDVQAANSLYSPWQMGIGNWWGIPLHKRFLMDADNRKDLTRTIMDLYQTYLTKEKITTLLDTYKPLVEGLITASPDVNHLPTVDNGDSSSKQWEQEYNRLATITKINFDRYLNSLQQPMPFWQSAEVGSEGNLSLAWDESYDMGGSSVTYDVQISSSPDFSSNIICSQTALTVTETTCAKPAAGTYYMRVTAKNSTNETTGAFDSYYDETTDTTYFGVLQFTVN